MKALRILVLEIGKTFLVAILMFVNLLINPREQCEDMYSLPCVTGSLSIVKMLLACGHLKTVVQINDAIRCASHSGHVEVVRVLLADKRVDPSASDNYAIRTASFNGHVEVAKLLLADERVDPSTDYNDAIRCASHSGHVEVVRVLLADKRVDPSDEDNYAIRCAASFGRLGVLKVLLADERVNPAASKASTEYFISWYREKQKCSDLVEQALLSLTSLDEDRIEEVLMFLRPTRASLGLQVKRRFAKMWEMK
jgi:hypothetical protein